MKSACWSSTPLQLQAWARQLTFKETLAPPALCFYPHSPSLSALRPLQLDNGRHEGRVCVREWTGRKAPTPSIVLDPHRRSPVSLTWTGSELSCHKPQVMRASTPASADSAGLRSFTSFWSRIVSLTHPLTQNSPQLSSGLIQIKTSFHFPPAPVEMGRLAGSWLGPAPDGKNRGRDP